MNTSIAAASFSWKALGRRRGNIIISLPSSQRGLLVTTTRRMPTSSSSASSSFLLSTSKCSHLVESRHLEKDDACLPGLPSITFSSMPTPEGATVAHVASRQHLSTTQQPADPCDYNSFYSCIPALGGSTSRSKGASYHPSSYSKNNHHQYHQPPLYSSSFLTIRMFSKDTSSSSDEQDEDKDEFYSSNNTTTTPSSSYPTRKPSSLSSSSGPMRPGEKLAFRMDREFQKYLTGEMIPPVTPPSAADLSSSSSPSATNRRKRRQRLPDPDLGLYQKIQQHQSRRKEKARLKTAQNVYRALMGNMVICAAKLGAWVSSGSSGMLAEFIHSVVDCGNQSLLLLGLRDAGMSPDRTHPYGYGKSVYFWALVSALGTFFLGAGISMTHAIGDVLQPSLHEITWHVWGVLLFSLAVDGYVLMQTLAEVRESKPADQSLWKHMMNLRDPATLAILLEDGAACLGVVMALSGIVAVHMSGNPIFDGLAGVGISTLLGLMGVILVRVNHRFLLGRAVDKEIVDDINKILLSRRSIESIGSIQSQWTGPDTFSYKAEVDFDGTYLAAKLMRFYQSEFLKIRDSMEDELQVLLAFYSEDVMRTVEREVRKSEALIRQKYPGAEYIELEPMSVDVDRLAIDDNLEAELRRVEEEALDRFMQSIRAESSSIKEQSADSNTTASADDSTTMSGLGGETNKK